MGSLLIHVVLCCVVSTVNSQNLDGLVNPEVYATGDEVDPINMEKTCDDYGTSVGMLEWRLWREGEELVAVCDLYNLEPRMGYTITWTLGQGLGSRKTTSVCEFSNRLVPKNEPLSCEYRLKLPRYEEGERVTCWVKSYNEWSSESMTCCASDEITLNSNTYMQWRDKHKRLAPLAALGYGLDNLIDIDNTSLRRQAPHPSRNYDQYVVEIDEYNSVKICPEGNLTRILKVDMRPRLDFIPHSITWNCSLSFATITKGLYSLLMIKGNVSDEHFDFGVYLKRCDRDQDNMIRPLNCEVTIPITNADINQQKFICKYIRRINNTIDYKIEDVNVCDSDQINYNIMTVTMFKDKLDEMHAAIAAEEEARVKEREVVSQYRAERLRGNNRTSLPWVTRPIKGPGVRLNGHQYMIMGVGSSTFILAFGCLVNMIRTKMRKTRENENAEPCLCRAEVDEETISESESDDSKKKGKPNRAAKTATGAKTARPA